MKEIWFGIANEQIVSSMFDRVICLRHDNGGVLYFNVFIFWFNIMWNIYLAYDTLITLSIGTARPLQ